MKKMLSQHGWLEHRAIFPQSKLHSSLPAHGSKFALVFHVSDCVCVSERSVKELQVTHKTDVFAFGVVLAELITGQRALFRDNREPGKMKSLITVVSFNPT